MKILLSSVIVPPPDIVEKIFEQLNYDFVFVPIEYEETFLEEI